MTEQIRLINICEKKSIEELFQRLQLNANNDFDFSATGFEQYERYLRLISKERRERIASCSSEKMKLQLLLTELLIKSEINERFGIPIDRIEFTYNEYGKPFVKLKESFEKDYVNFSFSVSHSGSYIAFVCAEQPIGIDIEQIKQPNLKLAKRFFTENEYSLLLDSPNAARSFCKIWTAKEAYVKMLGTGLSLGLNTFEVIGENAVACFESVENDGYLITVCREKG